MQDDNSMVEKILSDLENIIYSDDELRQFDIVPVLENDKNKSPVLYEQHNIGLEMWCIKHVYTYTHAYLLKVRKQIKKTLSQSEIETINRLLVAAVLIQPDVSTFWNMRRELIEMNLMKMDKELLLSKLVLTHKSKSNEAFSHRRWILKKIFKKLGASNTNSLEIITEKEFLVADMACQRVQNNYHAWTHKIWLIENVPDPTLKPVMIKREFTSSLDYIFFNVSEHSPYHYRQRLMIYLKNFVLPTDTYFMNLKLSVTNYLHIMHCSVESLLPYVLGEPSSSKSSELYNCFISVLLFELLYTCPELDKSFPGHESVWYHRRYIIYTLLKTIYEFFDINWERDIKINDSNLDKNSNIINSYSYDSKLQTKFQENGEKHPKIFKAEPKVIENSFLYKYLLKTESDFINTNSLSTNSSVQVSLAKRHENWLKYFMQISFS